MTLPYIKEHVKNWVLHDENLYTFQNLGFKITENGNKLVLTLVGDKQEILNKLNGILSKIVFEIFYFKEFESESYIQYTDIASR